MQAWVIEHNWRQEVQTPAALQGKADSIAFSAIFFATPVAGMETRCGIQCITGKSK